MYSFLQKMDVFFFSEPEEFDKSPSCEVANQNLTSFLKKGRSLFVVVPTAPLDNYENFTKEVLAFNGKEPFNFETPSFFRNQSFETVWNPKIWLNMALN